MVNVNKLKGKIVECGMNIEQIAKETGINKSTFYRKMNDKGDSFTISEADMIAKALQLTGREVNDIFFSQYVA
ncbi:Helix-turn-helix domain of resolvase [uncultured Eubacterium sp.]|nr:Helix-turn-helix domain of resolvase [uncultured Eubacterium sp.]